MRNGGEMRADGVVGSARLHLCVCVCVLCSPCPPHMSYHGSIESCELSEQTHRDVERVEHEEGWVGREARGGGSTNGTVHSEQY